MNKAFLIGQANRAFRDRRYEEAIALYEKLLVENPRLSEQVRFNLAMAKKKLALGRNGREEESHNSVSCVEFSPNPASKFFVGNIDIVDETRISGWIYDRRDISQDVVLDVYVDGEKVGESIANLERLDVASAGHKKLHCGFNISLVEHLNGFKFGIVKICLGGTNFLLFEREIVLEPLVSKVAALAKVANLLKSYTDREGRDSTLTWISDSLLPAVFREVRSGSLHVDPYRQVLPQKAAKDWTSITVDVVVPVYEGLEETVACIRSILASQQRFPFRLVVINDGSPNKELTEVLRKMQKECGFLLLENETNQGFVFTANRGMLFSSENDVLLLNSDTVVPSGMWLDHIREVAYQDSTIGTVTPFSNNATICSYPKFCEDNELPVDCTVNSLNELFWQVNGKAHVDLPTAHGFCMYIKREVIAQIGGFNQQKWGKGYGEENDFSLRAEMHGWRNVCATGVFVQHLGSVSFSSNAEEFINKNLKILFKEYPDYPRKVEAFIRLDPLRNFRDAVTEHLIRKEFERFQSQRSFLFISHALGGGTDVCVSDITTNLAKSGFYSLLLTSEKLRHWRLTSAVSGLSIQFNIENGFDSLIKFLTEFNIWLVQYHHVIDFDKRVWDLPGLLGCQYDLTLHDYFTVCPRANLMREAKVYCGDRVDPSVCNECISKNGVHESSRYGLKEYGSVELWREFFRTKLNSARKVYVPSEDARARISGYFPGISITVRPHPEPLAEVSAVQKSRESDVNVCFIGAVGDHKGYEFLEGCAKYAIEHDLPITFWVVGYTKNDAEILKLKNCRVTGRYKRNELSRLLSESPCDIALLLSVWPETFSYTLSEALRSGMKVIAFDIGAVRDRLPAGWGRLLPLGSSFSDVCDAIIGLRELNPEPVRIGQDYPDFIKDYYCLEIRGSAS